MNDEPSICEAMCGKISVRHARYRCISACKKIKGECNGDETCLDIYMDRWIRNHYAIISVKIPIDLLLELDEYVEKNNTTRSYIIRKAIKRFIANGVELTISSETKPIITRRLKIYPSIKG